MKQHFSVRKLALLGMMAAVVYAGNFARITMPVAIAGRTSFTLGNIFCCLSGLLLGPAGGLASGVGSALFDLLGDPRYASEFWITFLTKGAMGLCAALAVRHALREDRLTYPGALAGTVAGCAAYYVLYFAKSFFYDGLLLKSLTPAVAGALLLEKVPASLFNAAVAILAAPPLILAVRGALKRGGLSELLTS